MRQVGKDDVTRLANQKESLLAKNTTGEVECRTDPASHCFVTTHSKLIQIYSFICTYAFKINCIHKKYRINFECLENGTWLSPSPDTVESKALSPPE